MTILKLHTSARSYQRAPLSGSLFRWRKSSDCVLGIVLNPWKKVMWASHGNVVRLVASAAPRWVNPRAVLPLMQRQVSPCHGAAAQTVMDRVMVPANKFRNIAVVRTISTPCEAPCISVLKWRCVLQIHVQGAHGERMLTELCV